MAAVVVVVGGGGGGRGRRFGESRCLAESGLEPAASRPHVHCLNHLAVSLRCDVNESKKKKFLPWIPTGHGMLQKVAE